MLTSVYTKDHDAGCPWPKLLLNGRSILVFADCHKSTAESGQVSSSDVHICADARLSQWRTPWGRDDDLADLQRASPSPHTGKGDFGSSALVC